MTYSNYLSTELFKTDELFHVNRVCEATRSDCRYHTHDFVEICYVASGKGFHLLNGQECVVAKGDLFIINYEARHTFIRDADGQPLITYNLIFKPAFLDSVVKDITDLGFDKLPHAFLFHDINTSNNGEKNCSISTDDQQTFDNLFSSLLKEYLMKPPGYNSMAKAHMMQLIILITRKLCEEERSSGGTHQDFSYTLVDNIIDYLQKHFSEKINLNDLMFKSLFSKGYLCRVFKKATGMTISEYTQILRINEACLLIQRGNMRITEIAYKVGFSDYKSFFTTFKRITGKKPNEYR